MWLGDGRELGNTEELYRGSGYFMSFVHEMAPAVPVATASANNDDGDGCRGADARSSSGGGAC